ncbi:MAG: hypothetical protein LBQ31_11340 [Bacteroidales bacterium]|jgi:hypothetical protein|nr:hypothetical protein [Bacteroidales bacterium]
MYIHIKFSDDGVLTMICKNRYKFQRLQFKNFNAKGLSLLERRLEAAYSEEYAKLELDKDEEYFTAKLTIIP